MFINSKGKLFGKVSIIDILVIILIVAAVVGAYFRFKGNNVVAVNETTEYYYTISVKEIRESNKNLLEKSVGKKFRLDGKINSSMGELVKIDIFDAEKDMELNDGSIVNVAVPERYDVKLTFKVKGSKSDSGYYTPEMQEICVGKEYPITNIYCMVNGIVEKIWIK